MRVKDYKELRVYRLAFDSAMEIFQLRNDAASWCGHGNELRELPAQYFTGPITPAEHAPDAPRS